MHTYNEQYTRQRRLGGQEEGEEKGEGGEKGGEGETPMQHAPQKSKPKVMVMMSVWVALPPPHKHPKTTMHQDLESAQTLDWGTGSGSGCGTAQASKGMLMYWHSGEPSAYSELDSAHVPAELMAWCTLVNAIGNQARSKIHAPRIRESRPATR